MSLIKPANHVKNNIARVIHKETEISFTFYIENEDQKKFFKSFQDNPEFVAEYVHNVLGPNGKTAIN